MVTSNVKLRGAFSAALSRADLRAGLVSAAILAASASAGQAQAQLNAYTDAKGYLNVKALTCAQLANTFQEDADMLGVWYAGWLNGRAKKHMINVDRTKAGIHQVIVDCKDHPDMKVVDAVQAFVAKVQSGQ